MAMINRAKRIQIEEPAGETLIQIEILIQINI